MSVAEMYFRLSVNEVQHQRIVFKMMDWLGAIGGVEKILMKFIVFFLGGFAQFNSTLVTLKLHF